MRNLVRGPCPLPAFAPLPAKPPAAWGGCGDPLPLLSQGRRGQPSLYWSCESEKGAGVQAALPGPSTLLSASALSCPPPLNIPGRSSQQTRGQRSSASLRLCWTARGLLLPQSIGTAGQTCCPCRGEACWCRSHVVWVAVPHLALHAVPSLVIPPFAPS